MAGVVLTKVIVSREAVTWGQILKDAKNCSLIVQVPSTTKTEYLTLDFREVLGYSHSIGNEWFGFMPDLEMTADFLGDVSKGSCRDSIAASYLLQRSLTQW